MDLGAVTGAANSSSAWAAPGTLGFLVVFGMGVILYFVFRSLSKHLRKINEAARIEEAEQADPARDGLASSAARQDLSCRPSGSERSEIDRTLLGRRGAFRAGQRALVVSYHG